MYVPTSPDTEKANRAFGVVARARALATVTAIVATVAPLTGCGTLLGVDDLVPCEDDTCPDASVGFDAGTPPGATSHDGATGADVSVAPDTGGPSEDAEGEPDGAGAADGADARPGDGASDGPVRSDAGDAAPPSDGGTGGSDAAVPDARVDAPTEPPPVDAGKDTGVAATSAPPPDTGPPPCPGTAGPTPIRTGSFCIDSTEVTNTQYAQFLKANGTTPVGAPSKCSFNDTLEPASNWPAAAGAGNQPVADIDWCDAYAYCAWAGKRLCGKIGGGSVSPSDYDNASADQWYAACSAAGARTYPYGNSYVSQRCNDTGSVTVDVGSYASCVGGYSGVFDMSGNVWEWQDACDADSGVFDSCYLRGGSFAPSTTADLQCTGEYSTYRYEYYDDVGFRCCSDP